LTAIWLMPLTAAAQQIESVTVDPPQAAVGQSIETTIRFAAKIDSFSCGLVVSLGDGAKKEVRVTERENPLKIEHQYTTPGNYAITVEGKFIFRGLKTAPACGGHAISALILVTAAAPSGSVQLVKDELSELRREAHAGNTDAMFRFGNVVAQQGNDVEAARWFRSASERGNVKATNALGFMYEKGRGVPQNFAQAGRLYLQAMKKGDADAMVNRGLMFAQGRGVDVDLVEAYMHFLLSAAYAQDVGDGANVPEFGRFEIADGYGATRVVRAGNRSMN
ncbi:MAG: hypothetical protein B7Z74_00120, partial [Deltaproteobacteria bacterium 21-66-5]